MFEKYYKTHFWTLILGIIALFSDFLLKNYISELNVHLILTTIGILFFIVTMIFYFKIITVLNLVTEISKTQMWIAIIAHTLTLTALCFWNKIMIAVPLSFVGSIVLRKIAGITEIDGQMKELCIQLDFELYKIGMESEHEN